MRFKQYFPSSFISHTLQICLKKIEIHKKTIEIIFYSKKMYTNFDFYCFVQKYMYEYDYEFVSKKLNLKNKKGIFLNFRLIVFICSAMRLQKKSTF